MSNIENDINEFADRVRDLVAAHMKASFPSLDVPEIRVDFGTKYARIVRGDSAYCFVNMGNGDILKCAGWKAPAKHARGNIYDEYQGMNAVGPYGAVYMR